MNIRLNGVVVGKPLRIQIAPLMLEKFNAGALFDENSARLTLARSNILTGEIDDMVVHELRHAYNFYTFANGADHAFYAWVTYDEKLPPIHETYTHSFSVDELAAHVKQVVYQLRAGRRNPDLYESAIHYASSGLTLTQALTKPQVLSVSHSKIQKLINTPSAWALLHKTKINLGDDEPFDVWMYNAKSGSSRIYFYESPLLVEQESEVPIKITHAVIENGDYRIDMNTRMPLQTENMGPLLSQIRRKINDLSRRSKVIESAFRKSLESIEKADYDKALIHIESALPAIEIKSVVEQVNPL